MQFQATHSRNVLFRLTLGGAAVLAGLAFGSPYLADFYWREQLTAPAVILNGLIVVLFGLGLYRVVHILFRYVREEVALARFVRAMRDDEDSPTANIWPQSLVAERFEQIVRLSRHGAAINHAALAATLTAKEGTRLGLPRFVNGVLILLGVFGTIFSLNIALLGASDLLTDFQNPGNMGLIVQGMSTALTTTVTAIVCYLFFGLFYMQLTDVQTRLISGIEEVTALYLLPRYAPEADTVLRDLATLARSLQQVAERMHATQDDYIEATHELRSTTQAMDERFAALERELKAVRQPTAQEAAV